MSRFVADTDRGLTVTRSARPRALIVVRLSRLTDESTSPERQRAECERVCEARGWDVVGVAEDLDVSAGSTSPFDRPALSKWIGDGRDDPGRVGEFDVLVAYRVDRLVRRVRHLSRLIDWADDHGINVVSATESHFDLSTPVGRVIAQLVASFGEMELEAIAERNTNAFRHNVKLGKWTGGVPPWGYLPERDEAGDWRLVPDPEAVPVIRDVARRVLDGEPLRAIAHDMTVRGIPTAKDRVAISQGKAPAGYKWHPGPLKRSLTSPTMLGYSTTREPLIDAQGRVQRDSQGRKQFGPETVVRGDDGSPVQRAESILTRDEFDRLAVELASRENRTEPNKRTTSLLLGVVYCGVCGLPAYKLKGSAGRADRYRCRSVQDRDPCCSSPSTPIPYVDQAVTETILGMLGSSERLDRVWEPGEDTSAELAEIDATLTDLVGQLGTGAFRAGTPQRDALDARISALADRQLELQQTTTRLAGWSWQGTGETFGEWWSRQTDQDRNVWLNTMRVRVGFRYAEPKRTGARPTLEIELGEVAEMLQRVTPEGPAATVRDALQQISDAGVAGVEFADDGTVVVHER